MYEHETLRNEEAYIAKLTEQELLVYNFNSDRLAKLSSWLDYAIQDFISKALLLNSLHSQHANYNAMMEKYCYCSKTADDIEEVLQSSMQMTISIGSRAAVIDLDIMDDCDEVYCMLAKIKMTAFDVVCDNFDIDKLLA